MFMIKFGKFICKNKKLILIISFIFLIFSFIGMSLTKINYDILVYLPNDIETIKGQNILSDDFDMGAFSIAIIDNAKSKDILKIEDEIKKVEGVNNVMSVYDVFGTSIPIEILPNNLLDKVNKDNSNIIFITYEGSTSSESTLNAINEIRNLNDKIKLGGMSSLVIDTMELSQKEIVIYIVIAVILCTVVLTLALDSYIVPYLLLINIGFAIMFNMGTNIFLGEISYITKALVAVLQLGVTTDFSIFLYHSYESKKGKMKNEDAMVEAIKETFTSVLGSSLTTIAGFLVLCTMQLTLGKDLGIVMAKGVLLGVITVLTLFPSLLLMFDKLVTKTKHKEFIPNFTKLNKFVIKFNKPIFIIFLILLIPMYLAYSKVETYFKIDRSLPKTIESIKTNNRLKNDFGFVSTEMILIDKNLKKDDVNSIIKEVESVDGIDFVLSYSNINTEIVDLFKSDKYELLLVNSKYDVATNELNEQISLVNNIVKKYDKNAIVAGEGPLMKDLITISNQDFNNVNYSSIICIFIILFFVLRSLSLPILLISAIEFAIFTNMSFSYFSGTVLPFVAPIVIGTIQLGATIDYAILISTTYLENRKTEKNKEKAMLTTLNYAGTSIFISGMCFFAATFGVGIYSDLEMVGSLCALISRGALISMAVVITILPSILLIFDKLIMKTTLRKDDKMKNKFLKMMALSLLLVVNTNASALTKNETIYAKLNYDGKVNKVSITNQLINNENLDTITDYSILTDIFNLNNDDTYKLDNKKLIWNVKGKDVLYEGKTDKKLPIDVSITYKLDDKVMSLDDILGKSGRVEISINCKNNDSHNVIINGRYETIYTPFIVTAGTILDNNVKNIEISNGKIINNGNKNILLAIAAPGLSDSLKSKEFDSLNNITYSFDTDYFELSSIYSMVNSKLIDTSDLKIFNKLDTLFSSVNKLQDGINEIESGVSKIKNGSNQFRSELGKSIDSLKNNKTDALTKEQIEQITNTTVENVKNAYTDEYKDEIGNATWVEVKNNINNEIDIYVTQVKENTVISYLKAVDKYDDYVICENAKNKESMTEDEIASCEIINSDEVLPTLEKLIKDSLDPLTKKVSNIVFPYIEDFTKEIAVNVSEKTALEVAKNVSNTLTPTIANKVKDEALKEMTTNLNKLYDGIKQLDDGINVLSTGINKYNNEGINKLTDASNSAKTYSERLKAISKLEDYNYSGKLDKMNSETKFIMIIDSKKIEKKEEIKVSETKNLTIWDRIVNLFK